MAHTILLALQDAEERSKLADVLSEVGYHVIAAATFKVAMRLLASASPNVVVAEIRMGVYNGMQLLVTGRIDNARLTGVIIANSNGPLSEDIKRLGATDLLVRPVDSLLLLDAVARAIEQAEARRTPRRHVAPGLTCEVDGYPGWVVEASEEGLRVELPHPVPRALPQTLHVTLPTLALSLPARMAWAGGPMPSAFRYGLALLTSESDTAEHWRRFVHALPDR